MKMAMYLSAYFFAINLITFIFFGMDKRKAQKGKWRIKESTLFILSIAGGALGAILGMKFFHHKTKHKSFTIFIPLILIIETAIFILLYMQYCL